MSQERIEQERVRKIIYANLDRLFEELENLDSTERILKKRKGKSNEILSQAE